MGRMAIAFSFIVGIQERHTIAVERAGLNNRVKIAVDGVDVIDSGGNIGYPMPNVFDLEVGAREKHMVSVRFIRQMPIDGGAAYVDVFIDGRFAARHDMASIRR